MTQIRVNAGGGYDVVIGEGIDFGGALKERLKKVRKIALISDRTVFGLYGARVVKSLESAGFEVFSHTFTGGENSKNSAEYFKILEFLAEAKLTRSDAAAALGGGVTGDLAGFAAATYLRGINLVQIPTTLLAAVDSSVGGKTGINLSTGKNLAGAFHQPRAVLCDIGFLKTLSEDLIADGMGEIVKHAILKGGELLDELEKNNENNRNYDGFEENNDSARHSGVLKNNNGNTENYDGFEENKDSARHSGGLKNNNGNTENYDGFEENNDSTGHGGGSEKKNETGKNAYGGYNWEKIIALSVAVKAEIVEADEKEQNVRRLLNLGHTIGHAVEKLSGYQIRHGKCVSIGLLYIAALSREKGFLSGGEYERILKLLSKNRLDIPCPYGIDEMSEVILSDKKMSGAMLGAVVIRGIGRCAVEEIPAKEIRNFLRIGG
ncbi:MAG: 3-dehydroquinate synthase [Clostridiales bacterium]|jgi:3-dehydroquinate synthase|nr:3-dehydroquinate synthase [Clostridiales bacterium]